MKTIRNPNIHWPRLAELIEQIARARKNHQATAHLEREATAIRRLIIECELRQDRAA